MFQVRAGAAIALPMPPPPRTARALIAKAPAHPPAESECTSKRSKTTPLRQSWPKSRGAVIKIAGNQLGADSRTAIGRVKIFEEE